MRALIVEDDERLRTIIVRALTRLNLACDDAGSIAEAEELVDLHEYDVLVLDRRLPDGDGIAFCRASRDRGFANGILMLTAMDDARSTIEGLEEGADDYLGKPFDVEVLEARVRALLRRNARRPATILAAGSVRLDPARRAATCDGTPLSLTARELRLLEAFLRTPGSVLTREELMEQAWGEREEPMSNTIDVLIARLRRKLEAAGAAGVLETVRGAGYRLRSS
jgi:DNA-binding response OmpR family regulator